VFCSRSCLAILFTNWSTDQSTKEFVMSQNVNPLSMLAAAPGMGTTQAEGGSKWYELMAEAWGKTLDAKANDIEGIAAKISAGDDKPGTITQMSTMSLQMGFLSQSAHTSVSSVGAALETMARKQ
jgi:hypothetical protein